jgi:uncharacterized membrane protein
MVSNHLSAALRDAKSLIIKGHHSSGCLVGTTVGHTTVGLLTGNIGSHVDLTSGRLGTSSELSFSCGDARRIGPSA